MRKAQMEIMGLVVIVILIAVGVLFFLGFAIFNKPSDVNAKVTTSVVASSTLNSLQYTTTTCRGINVQDLLLDCATRQAIVCDGELSCSFVNRTISYILDKTLAVQDKTYNFKADVDGENLDSVSVGKGCRGERENAYQPLRTTYGTLLTLSLDVCR